MGLFNVDLYNGCPIYILACSFWLVYLNMPLQTQTVRYRMFGFMHAWRPVVRLQPFRIQNRK